jgi:hypothetical protein
MSRHGCDAVQITPLAHTLRTRKITCAATCGMIALLGLLAIVPGRAQPVWAAQVRSADSVQIDVTRRQLVVYRHGHVVFRSSIAPGRPQTPTPIGSFHVRNKQIGWGGGFGTRWIGLDIPWGTYGIHGTNKPSLIGQRVSGGCIRMQNADVERLFALVRPGMRVTIIGPPLGDPYHDLRELREGAVGTDVVVLQQILRAAGLYHGRLSGIFDEPTLSAWLRMERRLGGTVDGFVTVADYRKIGMEE